ncbi:MAG: hypothetical protein R6W96_01700 [Clostridia bacterium]
MFFEVHRKKKSFPFVVFGVIGILLPVSYFLFLLLQSVDMRELFREDAASIYEDLLNITIIFTGFCLMLFSFGITKRLHTRPGGFIYLAQAVFYLLVSLVGYFGNMPYKEEILRYTIGAGFVYFLLLLTGFVFSNKGKSDYESLPMMVLSLLPLIPFSILFIQVMTGTFLLYEMPGASFSNILKLSTAPLLAIHVLSNTIYLGILNKRL